MKCMELETLYSPYTLDTYNIFTLDSAIDSEIEYHNDNNTRQIDYNDFDCDMESYKKDLAIHLVELLNENILDDVILKITSDMKVISPSEYNYITDKIWLGLEYDEIKLDEYIEKNQADFDEKKIKSCSGFMWLGEEIDEKIIYYLNEVSGKKFSRDAYIISQFEDVSEYEYITILDE